MKFKIIIPMILFSSFSFANTIQISSTATPEGIDLEKFNHLHKLYLDSSETKIADKLKVATPQAAKAKADSEYNAKRYAAAKSRAEDSANKIAETRKIVSSAKRDFENKIKNAWRMPVGSTGQKATARVTLLDNGSVTSIFVSASDPVVKKSVEQAIRDAAPYPMSADPDVRREARSFTSSFTVK